MLLWQLVHKILSNCHSQKIAWCELQYFWLVCSIHLISGYNPSLLIFRCNIWLTVSIRSFRNEKSCRSCRISCNENKLNFCHCIMSFVSLRITNLGRLHLIRYLRWYYLLVRLTRLMLLVKIEWRLMQSYDISLVLLLVKLTRLMLFVKD